jgi:hypothetical protein
MGDREESGKIIPLGCMAGIVIAILGLIGIGISWTISSSKVIDFGASGWFFIGGVLAFVFGGIMTIVFWQ